jgi:hypothetical protein
MDDYSVLAFRAGYGKEPLSNDLDERIQALMQSVRSREEFAAARSAAGNRAWGMLNAFAERMASIAVRSSSTSDLRDGLVAVQLALVLTDDYRDVLPTVSLLHRASELIGTDPCRSFARWLVSLATHREATSFDISNAVPSSRRSR